VGFEPTIPAFERAKTLHASDGEATVIYSISLCPPLNQLDKILSGIHVFSSFAETIVRVRLSCLYLNPSSVIELYVSP
jgi:hypothetical protein